MLATAMTLATIAGLGHVASPNQRACYQWVQRAVLVRSGEALFAVRNRLGERMFTTRQAALRVLRDQHLGYLESVEYVLAECAESDTGAFGRDELTVLVARLKAVLGEHQLDDRGRCSSCGPRFGRWRLLGQPWPCPAVQVVHELIGTEDEVLRQFDLDAIPVMRRRPSRAS